MGESPTSPRRLVAISKQRQALELRAAGRNWEEIAKVLGYASHSGAIAAVNAALQKTLKEPADRLRSLTLERLTIILRTLWPKVIAGDLGATDRVLKAMTAMRSLMGLDAPVQHEVSGPGGGPVAIEHGFRSALVDKLTDAEVDAAIAEAEAITQGR